MTDFDTPGFIAHKSRLVVRGFYGEPATPAYDLRLITDKFWQSALARKAVTNLRRYNLRPVDLDDIEDKTPRAISLDYDPYFQDKFNRAQDWDLLVEPEERELRGGRLTELGDQLAKLQADLRGATSTSKTAELKQEIAEVEGHIARMRDGGPGYVRFVPDAFGDGVCGLYDPLSEPYVPRERITKYIIGRDTPFCVRALFYKPDEDEADWEFLIEWNVYRLVFSIDRVQFLRLNGELEEGELLAGEDDLKVLLDRGRITRQDTLWKAEQKKAIAAIKATAKDAGRTTEEKLTDDERSKIAAIEKAIDERWAAKKRRSGAEEEQIAKLRKRLYKETRTVEFGQSFETFFNVPLVLTFFPQRRGYLTIVLEGADSWTYEEVEVTKKRQPGVMWDAAPIRHRTNGGAYKFQVGVPDPKALGTLAIEPLDPGFDISGLTYSVDGYWDGKDESGDDLVTFDVKSIVGGSYQAAIGRAFRLLATLRPGPLPEAEPGVYVLQARPFPFLYQASLFIEPGERTGSDEVVWDSRDHEVEGVSRIIEVKPSFDERGGLSCAVEIRHARQDDGGVLGLGTGELGELPDLDGRIADLYLDDCEDTDVPYIARGLIRQPTITATQSAGEDVDVSAESLVSMTLRDRYAVLDDTMQARPVGDNKYLGRYARTVLACRGESEEEIDQIDEQLGRLIEGAGPGAEPATRPAQDTTYSNFLGHLLDMHGLVANGQAGGTALRLRWSGDAEGGFWIIEGDSGELLEIDGVLVHFKSDASDDSRFRLRESVDLPDDDSEVFNIFPVEGAKDPLTKEPIKWSHVVWESIRKPSDLRYISRPRPYKTVRDESLQTLDDVIRFSMLLASLHCRSKKFRRLRMPFIKQLKPGVQVLADGLRVELVKNESMSLAEDEMEWLARRLV